MHVAMTLDDLPMWRDSYPPAGYTAGSIMQCISSALSANGIHGVYGFSNSRAIAKHPELAEAMDCWVESGQYVGNHTHAHSELPDVDALTYCHDIDEADVWLASWLERSPTRYFRHPLCYWGETAEKRDLVARHLAKRGYLVADVSTWLFEWVWNRAWRNARERSDHATMTWLEHAFVDASIVQLRYDQASLRAWFGREVPGIALGHTVPFFAEVAGTLFERFIEAGVVFIQLEEAMADPAYREVGSVVSDRFLVFQQKLAHAAGRPMREIAPDTSAVHRRVVAMAGDRRD